MSSVAAILREAGWEAMELSVGAPHQPLPSSGHQAVPSDGQHQATASGHQALPSGGGWDGQPHAWSWDAGRRVYAPQIPVCATVCGRERLVCGTDSPSFPDDQVARKGSEEERGREAGEQGGREAEEQCAMPRGPAVHASAHCAHAKAEAAPPGPSAGCAAGLFQGALELAARNMVDHSDWMVRDAAVRLAGSLAAATVACIAPTATPSGGEQARADRVLGRLAEGLVCAATGDGKGYLRMAALKALAFATAPAATAGYAECYDCLAALEALPTATAHTPAQLQALRPTSVQADQQPHGHTLDRQQRLSPTLDRSHTLELPHKGAQGAAASQPGHSQSAAAESAREKAANDSAAAVPFPNCVVGCAAAAAAAAAAARLDELLADPTVLGACVRLGLEDSEALVRRAAMDLLTSWGASAQIAGLWAAPAAHACAARRHQLSIWVRRLANDSDWEVRLRILHLVRLLAALPPPPTPPLAGAPGQGRSEDGAAAGRLVHPGW